MNKRQKGKYRLEIGGVGGTSVEWFNDKTKAIARKEQLENYRDADSPTRSPFVISKFEFVPEEEMHRYTYGRSW